MQSRIFILEKQIIQLANAIFSTWIASGAILNRISLCTEIIIVKNDKMFFLNSVISLKTQVSELKVPINLSPSTRNMAYNMISSIFHGYFFAEKWHISEANLCIWATTTKFISVQFVECKYWGKFLVDIFCGTDIQKCYTLQSELDVKVQGQLKYTFWIDHLGIPVYPQW